MSTLRWFGLASERRGANKRQPWERLAVPVSLALGFVVADLVTNRLWLRFVVVLAVSVPACLVATAVIGRRSYRS
ncbi:MAG: hypothetical protein QOH95_2591 [Gaiellaceae bacterium]|nr:hypothetical protein [Gaiellaceae bacterium]